MYEGDNICYSCFEDRKSSASEFSREEKAGKNWGKYFIPIIGLAIAIGEGIRYGDDGGLYHVYINGYHEKWAHHYSDDSDLKKCCKCSNYRNSYYHLLSKE